jgi:cysteine desulfurase
VSTGSACESGASGVNYVLRAMGVGESLAAGMMRLSLGRFTTGQEIDYAIEQVRRCIVESRSKAS